jgi:hypothetical protein
LEVSEEDLRGDVSPADVAALLNAMRAIQEERASRGRLPTEAATQASVPEDTNNGEVVIKVEGPDDED